MAVEVDENTLTELDVLQRLREQSAVLTAIADATSTGLALQKQLRERFDEDVVRAALLLSELRIRGREKFSRATDMWFDRVGLEQSTSEAVARYKSSRFTKPVWDLCSGHGGDALAIAALQPVTAIDHNAATIQRLQWNADVYGVTDNLTTRVADVTNLLDEIRTADVQVHIDPDRRSAKGKRTLRIEDSTPGLAFLEELIDAAKGGAIRLSPAANFMGKFPGADTELISLNGECKEAAVWFGELATGREFRATVLTTRGDSMKPDVLTITGDPLLAFAETGPLQRYLHDPDPAVVRAGLVDVLAEELQLTRLDTAEEYLTSNELPQSAFVRSYEVLAELPNNDRAIRNAVRDQNAAAVEIKCRHIPIQAEAIRKKLPLGDGPLLTLVYARIINKARAIVCRRCV